MRISRFKIINRIKAFDPSGIRVDRHKRTQSIPMSQMFPPIPGYCSCGCGLPLTGRRTRWATDECSLFAGDVHAIICGHSSITMWYFEKLHPKECCRCGAKDMRQEYKNGLSVSLIKLDHIVPVKLGGGGCWLDNYQWLCHDCHVSKTNEDFGWKINKIK
jgi:5-methylcytosine-specific restriction endonuclease McrA